MAYLFKKADFPNILKILFFYCKHVRYFRLCRTAVFIMGNKWNDSRNRCSTELIRAELLNTINFERNCLNYFDFVKENKIVLANMRKHARYGFESFLFHCIFYVINIHVKAILLFVEFKIIFTLH